MHTGAKECPRLLIARGRCARRGAAGKTETVTCLSSWARAATATVASAMAAWAVWAVRALEAVAMVGGAREALEAAATVGGAKEASAAAATAGGAGTAARVAGLAARVEHQGRSHTQGVRYLSDSHSRGSASGLVAMRTNRVGGAEGEGQHPLSGRVRVSSLMTSRRHIMPGTID